MPGLSWPPERGSHATISNWGESLNWYCIFVPCSSIFFMKENHSSLFAYSYQLRRIRGWIGLQQCIIQPDGEKEHREERSPWAGTRAPTQNSSVYRAF
jgi:hypothetical protein